MADLDRMLRKAIEEAEPDVAAYRKRKIADLLYGRIMKECGGDVGPAATQLMRIGIAKFIKRFPPEKKKLDRSDDTTEG